VDWRDIDDDDLKRTDLDGFKLKQRYEKHIGRSLLPLEWATFREIRDELNINPEEVTQVHFLGIALELLRIGKPNFFFVAYVKPPYEELCLRMRRAREYWETEESTKPKRLQLGPKATDNAKKVLREAIIGDGYNPVTRMALFLLANCQGALDIDSTR
jgi:hypothetical protein